MKASPIVRILPDVHVLKFGGQSVMDRGRAAVYPLVAELVRLKKRHRMILCAGGGTRARHAYDIALGLGLPTGVLAALGEAPPRQNARMLQMLLAKHGGVYIMPDDFDKLPLYLAMGCLPIMSGMPPYDYWEKPPLGARIPANRTDSGTYLTAEFLGAKSLTYIKDVDGLYTADPKKDRKAKLIPRISVSELIALDLGDLALERVVLENMLHARHMTSLRIVNGLKPGSVARALDGKDVGTLIYRD